MSKNKFLLPLIIMASLFFLFGFITTMNNSTIDFLKSAFGLNDVEKQLPNFFFYGSYALSIPVGLLLAKIGYRNGVLLGLALIAAGFFLCIFGVGFGYYTFLATVSVFAIGVVILQVVAGPYVNALGPAKTAASRLTLTNALNSVATVFAPVFVSVLLVTPDLGEGQSLTNSEIKEIVRNPFFMIGIATLAILVIMFFLKLPEIKEGEADEAGGARKSYKSSAFKYPHVWLGSLAIFVYMGIEIGIPSFFADYVKKLGIPDINPTEMLMYYWGGLMVGRILGIFVLRQFHASTILTVCALGGTAILALSFILGAGSPVLAMWLFLATGLFHSIMWPVIYNLSLEDLGPHSKVASGVIATSVIGAGILTLLMAKIQTATSSVVIAVSCLFIYYLYLVFFAQRGSKIRT